MFEGLTINQSIGLVCCIIGGAIAGGFICWRIMYRLWCFVDDKKKIIEFNVVFYVMYGFGLFCAGIVLYLVLSLCRVAWIHVVVHVPVITYLFIAIFALVVYILRYVRRTHKAIHGHTNNPKAHTKKEKNEEYIKVLDSENARYKS